jgi:hypothetical protein
MFFRKGKKKVWKSIKKVDKIITSVIIGWAVVSIFWLSRTKKWKKITSWLFWWIKNIFRWWYCIFWKALARTIWFFFKKK